METGHGMGHIVRCLNLAQAFEKKDKVEILFLTRGTQAIDKIHYDKGIIAENLPEKVVMDRAEEFKAEVFLMDILDIDFKILKAMRKRGIITITLFDFPFDGDIPSDVVINPNPTMINYKSKKSKCLLGPRYMILGDCFGRKKKQIKERVDSVMVTMGGSDPRDYTSKAIETLKDLNVGVGVVVGTLSMNKNKVRNHISQLANFNFAWDITNQEMCRLMLENDLLLCTAGNTMYEACSLGMPTIILCNHPEHQRIARVFEEREAVINLGIEPRISAIKQAINCLIDDFSRRGSMSNAAKELVDGEGTERIVNIINILGGGR